jgi:HSP20 family molecular chaperone IbpA
MQPDMIQMMRTQVRAIHVALTGSDVPEPEATPAPSAEGTQPPTPPTEDVMQRFLELEAVARTLPSVASKVPPFAFVPPLDVVAGDDGVVLELAIPGVAREDVEVNRIPGGLAVRGIRRDPSPRGGGFHIESPRGPFYRAIPLPYPLETPPKFELDRGVLRIHVPAGQSPANKTQEPRRK